MLGTLWNNGQTAARDAHVAATKQRDTKEQQTTSESDSRQNVEITERKSPERSIETETSTHDVLLFKDIAQGVGNEKEQVNEKKREADDACEEAGTDAIYCRDAVKEAETRSPLSETEEEKGEVTRDSEETGSTGSVEETRDEHASHADVTTEHDVAETKPGPPAVTTEAKNATALGTRSETAAVVSSLKDGAPGVENVEGNVNENKGEDDGELCTDLTKLDNVSHGEETADDANIKTLLSETEQEKGKVTISSTGDIEEIHDEQVMLADAEPTAAERKPVPLDRPSSENDTSISEPHFDASDSVPVPDSSQHLLPPAADDPVKVTSPVLDAYNGRQAACDADVAATKQHDTKEKQTTSDTDSKQSVENSERESPVRSAEKHQEAALFKDNAGDEVGIHAELSENRCEDVVQEAKIQPLLRESERGKGEVEQKNDSTKPTMERDAAETDETKTAGLTEEKNATALGTRSETAAVVSSLKDGAPGVENVEEKVNENKRGDNCELCTDLTKLDNVSHGEEAADEANIQTLLSGNKQGNSKVNQETSSTGDLEETHDEQVMPADAEPTAAETKPGLPDRLSSENNAAISEPHSGVSDSVSVSEYLLSSQHLLSLAADDPVKDRHLKHNDAVHVQSQDESEEQKVETDDQEHVSQSEKPKDESEQTFGCGEMEPDSNLADAVKYSDKPAAAETEPEEQSTLKEESESQRVSLEIKTQSESTHDEAVEAKVNISMDDDKTTCETTKRSPGYLAAVKKVKEPLRTTSEKPNDNSVLNCLRFYTREEHLDEYFCSTCNEGQLTLLVAT